MQKRDQLLALLADGRFHSGETLGGHLGVTRSAVYKHIQAINELGLDVHAVTGKGYRLARPLELLDAQAILETVGSGIRRDLNTIEILPDVDSTNRYLLERMRRGASSGTAVFAERQRQGRGRRGRSWQSPFGTNVYLSILWRFHAGPAELSGLTLALGVGVARALRELGLADAGLKWPNDILWSGRKLAGVLVEVSGEVTGPCHAVVGVGLNLYLPACAARAIDRPWTDLETALGERPPRNRAAGLLLKHLLQVLKQYQTGGLATFMGEWRRLDIALGRTIELQSESGNVRGIARGIDADGLLIIERDGKRRHYPYGEISLRFPVDDPQQRPLSSGEPA